MKSIAVLLLLFINAGASAQWVELFRIPTEAQSIEMDVLLNLYAIKDTELHKYDSDGNFQFQYSDKQLGKITEIDVSFPLRILVIYEAINYIAMVDNTLSNNRGSINLRDLNIGLATAACSSVQNNFWFYDVMSFSLTRYNENFKKVLETGNLAQILGVELKPQYMVEYANRLYVNNPESGVLVFDIFGTYIKNIPVTGIHKFQVFENGMAYFKEGKLCKYDFRKNEITKVELPLQATECVTQKDRVALLFEGEIVVFKHVIP